MELILEDPSSEPLSLLNYTNIWVHGNDALSIYHVQLDSLQSHDERFVEYYLIYDDFWETNWSFSSGAHNSQFTICQMQTILKQSI